MEKEGKILIIPSKRLSPDLLAASFTIARVFKDRLGKKVEIGFDPENIPSYLSDIFPTKDLKFIKEIQSKSFSIKLKAKDTKIKDVKWEEVNGEIKLLITTDKGVISEDAKVQSLGDNFDKIIVIGIQKLEQIGKLYTDNKEAFTSSEIINIDLADNNTNFGTNNSFVKPDASSFSELAFEYLNETGLNPAAKEATDLLSGIIWKTKSFQIGIQKPSTFQACSELLNLNASLFEANKQVFQTLNLSQFRYINEIIKSVEIASDNIAWAKIYKINLNTLNANEVVFPLLNLLTYIRDVKISFVLTEIDHDTTLCDMRSSQKSIKASQIAEIFGKSGSAEYANFVIDMPLSAAHKKLLTEIRKIMSGSFTKKQNPEIEVEKTKTINEERDEDIAKEIKIIDDEQTGEIEEDFDDEKTEPVEEINKSELNDEIETEELTELESEEDDEANVESMEDEFDESDEDDELGEIDDEEEDDEEETDLSTEVKTEEIIPYSENKPSPPVETSSDLSSNTPPANPSAPFDPLPPAKPQEA